MNIERAISTLQDFHEPVTQGDARSVPFRDLNSLGADASNP